METEYGVFDHRHTTNPLASIRFNETEKFIDHYLLESYMELFMYKKVAKYMGLTFDQFIDRPRYEIDKMIDIIDKFIANEDSVHKESLKELADSNKQTK